MKKKLYKLKILLLTFLSTSLLILTCGQDTGESKDMRAIRGKVILHIYLVRHAEAYKNIMPISDLPPEKLDSLTEKGLDQAHALGTYLKNKNIKAIYASPTGRTRQTAEIIRQTLDIPEEIVVDAKFAALQQGLTPEGQPVSWSWRIEQWKKGIDTRPVNGESIADGQRRLISRIESISKTFPGESIVIVTHGDICTALLAHAADTNFSEASELHEVATGSVSEIVITEEQWHLFQQNITPAYK